MSVDGRQSFNALVSLLEPELRRIARCMRWRHGGDPSLTTTALVNTTYIRLKKGDESGSVGRAEFLNLWARAMRCILIDYARRRNTLKRKANLVTLDDEIVTRADAAADTIEVIHEALDHLSAFDPRLALIVMYRYFGGMSHKEIGEVLGCSEDKVRREWQRARIWLYRHLGSCTRPRAGLKPVHRARLPRHRSPLSERPAASSKDVDSLLQDALELDAAERDAFVEDLRSKDPAVCELLVTELSSLENVVPALLSEDVLAAALPLISHVEDLSARLMIGRLVGPYKLVREIGRG
jgi:RNA polymerase sigma factor (TIGR02999 family)